MPGTTRKRPLFSAGYQLDLVICLGLILAIFIPYQQVATHRFIEYDDGVYAFYNNYVIKGLCWDSIKWAFTNTDSANWHPLTWLSHLVDRELFGPYAGGYFLANVAWHSLAACLCYIAFLRITTKRFFALAVALVFALHPANVENVAWAAERKSLLNAVFWFWSLIEYAIFISTRSRRAYGRCIIAFLLSLLCKPMSVTLPFTLSLIHFLYWSYHPSAIPKEVKFGSRLWIALSPIAPLLVLSLYFSAVTMVAQSMAMPHGVYTLTDRLVNVTRSYYSYLAIYFHPDRLALFYPLFKSELTFNSALPGATVFVLTSTVTLCVARQKPQFLIGWCWYLGTMVPAVGLVQVGSQSHADRYLYIPMIGLAFLLPVLIEMLSSLSVKIRSWVGGSALAILALSMAAITSIQASYWKDGVTLFKHSLEITGDCVTSVNNLLVAYSRAGRFAEQIAFADAKIAVAQNPQNKAKFASLKAIAYYNLHKFESAIECANSAIALGDDESATYWTLARANFELKEWKRAHDFLVKAKKAETAKSDSDFVQERRSVQMTEFESLLKEKLDASSTGDVKALQPTLERSAGKGLERLPE